MTLEEACQLPDVVEFNRRCEELNTDEKVAQFLATASPEEIAELKRLRLSHARSILSAVTSNPEEALSNETQQKLDFIKDSLTETVQKANKQ